MINYTETTASTGNRLAALITAAGMSSRMKLFKPMLPLGDKSMIERQIDTLQRAGCSPIVIVTGHRAKELKRHLCKYNVEFVHNKRYQDTQMLDSIRIGLEYLMGRCQRAVLTPVDVPMFSEQTVGALINIDALVAIPTYEGMDGHPILLRSPLFCSILEQKVSGGLRDILAMYASNISRIAVEDKAILPDVDTPADYLALLKRYHLTDTPYKYKEEHLIEIIGLMSKYDASPDVLLHCNVVAREAIQIASNLIYAGVKLDLAMIHEAAMLHDIARKFPNHASTGAEWLRHEGLCPIADIVECHYDLPIYDLHNLTEKTIVYYADKIVSEREVVTLENRFKLSAERCKTEEARLAHKRRYEQAVQAEQLIMRRLQASASA